MKKSSFLVCGGTFDLFHKGHREFINKALESADKVLLGITSDEYIRSVKKKNKLQSFSIRKKEVINYLSSVNALKKTKIVKINNAYEPFLTTSLNYDAILTTKKVHKVALEINNVRKENGICDLKIINSPVILASDGLEISSDRIRNGEINRKGLVYLNPKWKNKTLILPQYLRPMLQKPWGRVLKKIPKGLKGSETIVVGDITAQKFNQGKIGQLLSIVDFLVNRKIRFKNLSELGFKNEYIQRVKSPRGKITYELLESVKESFISKKRKVILVEGEDDLSALVVLLMTPLGFSIFYGQPNKGLVWLKATEENKDKAYALLNNFELAKL